MRIANVPTIDGKLDNVPAYEVDDFPFKDLNTATFKTRKKRKKNTYCEAFGTFDIETTTITQYSDIPFGYMYHWQMCIDGICVYGRTWYEWLSFIDTLVKELHISIDNHICLFVHNLGFEFQFMRTFLERRYGKPDVFATHTRKPIKITYPNGLEFRCTYFLSNMSLYKATTTEKGVYHIKAKGDLDYKKIRTYLTYMDDTEFSYCIGDVISLWEYVKARLENEGDNVSTMPITSTGYVRRDCRNVCVKSKKYRYYFHKCTLTSKVYLLLNEASRGGNTHANRFFAGRIWHDVYSFDETSAYPFVMLTSDEYPISKFFHYGEIESDEELEELLEKYCCLFRVHFKNLRLKKRVPIPYLAIAKALYAPKACKNDNGRVLEAESYSTTIFGIDWKIIREQYEWDEVSISDFYVARKGMLPEELRAKILEYFVKKCELRIEIDKEKNKGKNADKEKLADLEYLYMKMKNRLNGIFGMCYSQIVRPKVYIDNEGLWHEDLDNTDDAIQEAIDAYYNNANSFLYFAHGGMTTALARQHLQRLINMTDTEQGGVCLYVDTDSSKCLNPDFDMIAKANEEIKELDRRTGAFVEVEGKEFYLGVYDFEGKYDTFSTLGAKKYCYTQDGELHITISGVNKTEGAKELKDINNFRVGFTFNKSAGSTLYYNDDNTIHNITIEGATFETSSNIGIVDSTYTIGITDEYAEVLGYSLIDEL